MADNTGRELDWEDSIEKESDFILLPAGDYDFTVTGFERGRHGGSAKLPPCNKAVITLEITDAEGSKVTLTHNLFLHTITEGMLSAFFGAIGQKKHGEALSMNWSSVPGSTGRCKIAVRDWKNDDGEDRQSNDIKKFYPKEEQPFVAGSF